MIFAAPAIGYPIIYGIDMQTQKEQIAADCSMEAILKTLGASAVVYQPLEALMDPYNDFPCCYACSNGDYPTGSCSDVVPDIARDKQTSHRG